MIIQSSLKCRPGYITLTDLKPPQFDPQLLLDEIQRNKRLYWNHLPPSTGIYFS